MIPGQGTRSHMLQPRLGTAKLKKKKKKNGNRSKRTKKKMRRKKKETDKNAKEETGYLFKVSQVTEKQLPEPED